MVKNFITFEYKSSEYINSLNYNSDQNGNVWSLINPAIFNLYDDNGNIIGNVQFIDNCTALKSTNDFQNSYQLIYETIVFNIINQGAVICNYAFVSTNVSYPTTLVVPTVTGATDAFYNNIDKVAINIYPDGKRQVYITLLN